MDDKYFLINLNLFTMNHSVHLIDKDSANSFGWIDSEKLPKAIVNYSNETGTYKIKINGKKSYAEGLVSDICNEEIRLYNMNKLEIEVI